MLRINKIYFKTFFLCFLGLSLWGCEPKTTNPPPNVLMISIDDLNDWVGVLSEHPNAITPNIDRLAREGVLFTNVHCQAPICGPSRASLMSGLRPSTTGIYGQIKDKDIRSAHPILTNIDFLPNYFNKQGYKTLGVGKIFHKHAPEGTFDVSGGREKGFGPSPPKSLNWDKKGTVTDWGVYPSADSLMIDYKVSQWAKNELLVGHEKPFFLAVGFIRPHVPWHAPQKWFDLHPLKDIKLPSYEANDFDDLPEIAKRIAFKGMMPTTDWAIENNQWKKIIQAYLACISFVDHQVGEVLKALNDGPNNKNTIVVLWSDHGYEIGEKGSFGKHTVWSESTRVPMIFKIPGQPANQVVNTAVELLDIYPSLLELCNLPKNPLNEGKSLVPLINGETEINRVAITTYGANNHSFVNETHRYIIYEDGSEELYDLRLDPEERNNLALDENTEDIKLSFKSKTPKKNASWSPKSFLTINEYFKTKN